MRTCREPLGEASIRVKSLRLFHITQTDVMNAGEKKAAIAALEEKREKRTSDKLPQVSPVEVPKAQPAPKNAKVLTREPGNA